MATKEPGAIPFADLHERAKGLLRTGVLPRGPAVRTYGGYGDGTTCVLCSGPIGPLEVEYELEFGSQDTQHAHLHLACHAIWDYERRAAAVDSPR